MLCARTFSCPLTSSLAGSGAAPDSGPRTRSALWALTLLVTLTGCGGDRSAEPLYPVRGTVTAGGRPAPTGDIVFVPVEETQGATPLRARIEPDGTYTLRTGAPAGRYRVAVVLDDTKELKTPIDPKIGSTKLTPLMVEVALDRPAGAYDLKLDPHRSK